MELFWCVTLLSVLAAGRVLGASVTAPVVESEENKCGNMTRQGPHDMDCLVLWWYEAGCSERGWKSPDTNPDISWWQARTAAEVKADMRLYYEYSTQGQSGHGTIYANLCGNCGADQERGPHDFWCLSLWWQEAGCYDNGLMNPYRHRNTWWHAQTVARVKSDMQLYAKWAREGRSTSGGWPYRRLCGTPNDLP